MINIDEIISDAAKSKSPSLGVFRLIKAEFLRWQKDNPGKEIDERQQVKILQKMYDQRVESAKMYSENGREDLANNETWEAATINKFLPEPVPESEIENYTTEICDKLRDGGYNITMRDMKSILSQVQEKYPDANGKIVSKIVRYYA